MGIYLPIAEMSVNVFVLLAMGAAVGFLSGMFGVGGGFLITPLLIFYNIPPAIAVATGANQVIASSFSGALAHFKRGTLDFKLGTVLLAGGIVGSTLGIYVFALLREHRPARPVHLAALRGVARHRRRADAGRERQRASGARAAARRADAEEARPAQLDPPAAAEDAVPGVEALRQRHSGARRSAPAIGFLSSIMGVGGGFIMVPALIYLLKVPTNVVVGTSLFQIIFVAAFTTIVHATANQTVDIVLAFVLMVGGVAGAQYGAKAGQKLRGEQLRALLALLVLAVALRLAFDLFVRPPASTR